MTKRFHVNKEGNPGACGAKQGGCPFGGDSDHYGSAKDARAAYELKKNEGTGLSGQKKSEKTKPPVNHDWDNLPPANNIRPGDTVKGRYETYSVEKVDYDRAFESDGVTYVPISGKHTAKEGNQNTDWTKIVPLE